MARILGQDLCHPEALLREKGVGIETHLHMTILTGYFFTKW